MKAKAQDLWGQQVKGHPTLPAERILLLCVRQKGAVCSWSGIYTSVFFQDLGAADSHVRGINSLDYLSTSPSVPSPNSSSCRWLDFVASGINFSFSSCSGSPDWSGHCPVRFLQMRDWEEGIWKPKPPSSSPTVVNMLSETRDSALETPQ